MRPSENCDDPILNVAEQAVVPGRVSRVWVNERIGEPPIIGLIVVLVESNYEKAVVHPTAEALLKTYDPHARHFELRHELNYA